MSFRILDSYRVTFEYVFRPRFVAQSLEPLGTNTATEPNEETVAGTAQVSEHELEAFLKVLIYNGAHTFAVEKETRP